MLVKNSSTPAAPPLDLTHVIDGFSGNEHNFSMSPIYRDVAELFAQSGLFYTLTLMSSYIAHISQ